jgi:hypothetical protein
VNLNKPILNLLLPSRELVIVLHGDEKNEVGKRKKKLKEGLN